MPLPAIRVVGLSKRYQLGVRDTLDGSFREMLVSLATAPTRRLRRLSGAASHESFWALKDVSFEVQPGEVTGVIGRNGAGKSTLLKVLSRITEPTSGRIELRGRVASLLEVGTGFHPDLTGRENVYLNGAILGMRRAEIRRKFDAIVDFAEVAKFIDTPVKHYSSGMYLRLAFAVAAHLEGEILLVDEVLAVGDMVFQKKCLGKMQEVSRGGRSVVFISHNMSAIAALCDRAIVLAGGQRVFDGPVQDAVQHYIAENLDETSTTWDLASLPRTTPEIGHTARLSCASLHMMHPDGFAFGEPMRFRVSFESSVRLNHLVCALNLDDVSGTRVVTFESDDWSASCEGGPGQYELEATVQPFGLRPGKYLVSASLYSGAHYHDYLVHFGVVSVVPFDPQRQHHIEERPDRGAIFAPSSWRLVNKVETVSVP